MAEEIIKRADSKGVLKSFTANILTATVTPNFSFDAVIDLLDKDPIARGAVNHWVAKAMEGDYAILNRESQLYDRVAELRLEEKYNFRTNILRKIFLSAKFFNNVFIEIVRDSDGRTKELNILDSNNVEAITKQNGDLEKLKSKIASPIDGTYPEWEGKDVVWIKFGDRTTGWAPVDFRALWENLLLKQYIFRYTAWLWKTGQYRLMYNPKAAADSDIEDFIAFMQKNEGNPFTPFIFKGELDTKILRDISETKDITELLKYVDNQTLVLLRVPPVDAGIPDASGRSSADAQSNNLITSIVDIHKIVEDSINYDLFPKINKSTMMIRFGPVDRFAEKQVFEVVQIMKSMGMTDDICIEFMKDRGMFFADEKVFNEPIEADPIMGAAKNPRDKDNAPSRKGKGAGEGNKEQEQVTTRTDQLKKV